MEFAHHARVGAPPDAVFAYLADVEHVAACVPGAQVTDHLGDGRYAGIVRVKMTAVRVTLTGDLEWLPDDLTHRIALVGRGRDSRRGNTASGRIVVSIEPDVDSGSLLTFESSIDIAGRLAQLGRGIISDVAARIISDFARRVEAALSGEQVSPAPDYLDVGSATAGAVRDRAGRLFRGITSRRD